MVRSGLHAPERQLLVGLASHSQAHTNGRGYLRSGDALGHRPNLLLCLSALPIRSGAFAEGNVRWSRNGNGTHYHEAGVEGIGNYQR